MCRVPWEALIRSISEFVLKDMLKSIFLLMHNLIFSACLQVPSIWFEMWGGNLGWHFSSLCADACENPHFTNYSHRSALFPVMFLLVRSHFQECPPCARFSQTANEAESLPGGLQSLWNSSLQMQILNASLEQPHLETVLQGGTQSDVYWKEENKTSPWHQFF